MKHQMGPNTRSTSCYDSLGNSVSDDEWCAFALSQIIKYVKQEKGCPYPAPATPQLSVRTTGALVPMNERSFHMRSLLVSESMPWTHGNRYSELPKPMPWPDEWVVNMCKIVSMSSSQKSKEPFCRTYCVQSCGSMLLDCTCPIAKISRA